jgi:predicted PurR-regulated permease PerM
MSDHPSDRPGDPASRTPPPASPRPAAPAAAPALPSVPIAPPGGRAGGPPGDAAAARHTERRSRHPGWRSRDILRTAALVIAFYLALRLLWFAQHLVLVTFLGVLFGLAATAAVDRLERWRIPRGIAAALTVFGTVGLIVGFFAWTAPTLREQSRELQNKLPEAVDKIEQWVAQRQAGMLGLVLGGGGQRGDSSGAAADTSRAPSTAGTRDTASRDSTAAGAAPDGRSQGAVGGVASAAPQFVDSLRSRMGVSDPTPSRDTASAGADAQGGDGALRGQVMEGMGSARRYLFSFVTSTFAALAGIILVIFLAVYVAASPRVYHGGLMRLFPRPARPRAGEVLTAVATVLRRWLVTQLIAMVVIGVVTTVVLLLLDVRAAFPLGVLAGLLEFVPTIGPVISAVPAIAMGFVDSPEKAFWVAIAYVGIQFLENHILIPILMKEGVDLPPAVTIVTQALMALVFGFLGLLVAVPMLAAASVVLRMLYVEDVVGEPAPALDGDDDDD